MIKRLSILFSLCCIGGVTQAQGATLPVPTVEYSADRVIESDAGTIEGKVYSARGKERTEANMGGMQSVMILRRDQQIGWMLMPAHKMYREMDFAKAQQQSGAAPEEQVEITQLGNESVAGFDSTKYQMMMKDGSAGGFIWITQDGIPVKMDMLSKSGRDKTRITMTLKNLTIGSQDAQLFELPSDYSPMSGIGGFTMSKPSAGELGMSKSPFSVGKALKGALFKLE